MRKCFFRSGPFRAFAAALVTTAIGCGKSTSEPPEPAPASSTAQASVDSPPVSSVEAPSADIGPTDSSIDPGVRVSPDAAGPINVAVPPVRNVSRGGRSPVVTPLHEPQGIEALKTKPLYQFNEREVDIYLWYLSQVEPDPLKRLLHLARKNIGQPYELYLLGEFPYETYDPDPMYCLSKSDCVTFSEHMYAMAFARDWGSFFRVLQRLRYKDGQVGMLTRNHETLCDWNRNNAWLFADLTRALGQGGQWAAMDVTWRPSRFFGQFGIGQDLPDVKLAEVYIPRKNIPAVLADLRDGDFVNVIRGDAGSQWCGHVGIIGHSPAGEVHFIHSSQPSVREQPLLGYLQRNASTVGLRFLRPRPDAQRVVNELLNLPPLELATKPAGIPSAPAGPQRPKAEPARTPARPRGANSRTARPAQPASSARNRAAQGRR